MLLVEYCIDRVRFCGATLLISLIMSLDGRVDRFLFCMKGVLLNSADRLLT